MKKFSILLTIGALLAACAPRASTTPALPVPSPTATEIISTPAVISGSNALWISPAVPEPLRKLAEAWDAPAARDAAQAGVRLDVAQAAAPGASHWIYALVAPFPTVMDGLTSDQLQMAWKGLSSASFGQWPMLMNASTMAAFSEVWGEPGPGVQVLPDDQLVDAAWKQMPAWAIVPFEALDPRWKVLTVDGQSPLRKDFDGGKYPLALNFAVRGDHPSSFVLPPSNRDSSKLTTLIMTGTSALVREIAYQMEVKGLDYPAQDIGDTLRQADLMHISYEVSFDPSCPPPNPDKNRFYCSDPRYIQLFDDAGVDIVELTGNHILDNGAPSFLYTLDLLKQHDMSYFGGGANLTDAARPLLVESNGNKLAFLGCNDGELPEPFATDVQPGANPCNYSSLKSQIKQLRLAGYLPIVTFQYKEGYSPEVMPWQEYDFRQVAEAGAVIVSGSQSHVPMKMEFDNGTFIHYGLGNLFFGQMGNQPPGPGLPLQPAERYEFLDRHVFYAGRYIGTELLTAMLEDYARPRPMTPGERAAFLVAYFGYSGWLPLIPTPAPAQTPTKYPLLHFDPLPTHTPLAPTP